MWRCTACYQLSYLHWTGEPSCGGVRPAINFLIFIGQVSHRVAVHGLLSTFLFDSCDVDLHISVRTSFVMLYQRVYLILFLADGSAIDDSAFNPGHDVLRDTFCDDFWLRHHRWLCPRSLHTVRGKWSDSVD